MLKREDWTERRWEMLLKREDEAGIAVDEELRRTRMRRSRGNAGTDAEKGGSGRYEVLKGG